ncbi:Calx-beta domain-containing protein [Candidatus Poriferisodalis sp.]|uniref:Calx-beta domain-containing protein n=1 Tax=Candidatus Poriferisodalis sp. TaxID=3101277 RepID=UPI003AF9CB13
MASPAISSVSISSSPANTLFYLTGETIRFSVNFTAVVEVEGSPTLAADVGGTEREAAFESVRGSEMLFGYTVTDDDFDSDGVSVGADSLSLGSGGAIADSASRVASLTHSAVAAGTGHRVNMSIVTVAADSGDVPVPENESARFTLSRTGSLSRALTVSLRAERRQYFVYTSRVPSAVEFEAGQATVQFEVPLHNDSDVETEDGSLTVIVAQGEGYLVGSPGSAVALLTDDNDYLFTISSSTGGHIIEGQRSSVTMTVTLRSDGPVRDRRPDPIGFLVAARNIETTSTRQPSLHPGDIMGFAAEIGVEPEDWEIFTTQDPFGRPLDQYGITIPVHTTIFDDLEPEIPERFRVIVDRSRFTARRTFVGILPIESVFQIVDNEGSFDVRVDRPRVMDIVEGDVLELGLTAVSRFRFVPPASTAVEVELEFEDGTASHGTDFVQLDRSTSATETVEITGFGTVDLGDHRRHQATSTVRISAIDNNDVDAVREFGVRFAKTPIAPDDQDYDADECAGDPPPDTPTCYGQNHFLDFFPADLDGDAGLSGYSMVVRIHDNDATPVAVAADASSIDEGEDAVFTVTRNPSAADLLDPLTVSFDITETAGFIDYSDGFVLPTSVTIAAGDTTATITIPTVDDNVGDGPGEVVATLRPGTAEPGSRYSYTLAGRSASVAVSEDEPVMTIADASVSEGAGTVDLVVTLSGTSADAIGFAWATETGTGDSAATAGQDYESAGGTAEIPAGQTSATLTVTITDDALDEPDSETFAVDLSAVTGASVAQPRATVTVTDNDALPGFSISDAEATEGSGASVEFTVSLDAPSGRPTEVEWLAVSDEDDDWPASEDFDYQRIGGTLAFAAGETEATVSVQLLDDGDHEPTETFELRLANATNSVITDDTGEGRILDDDTPTISIDDLSVSESAGTAQATVRLSRPAYGEVTLRYGTAAGTAIAVGDYTAQSQVGVTIPAGLTTATVAVPIVADDMYEADESFFVDLSGADGADLGSDTRAVITIVDDDAPPTLSVADAQAVTEGAGPLVFTVTRAGQTSLPATFAWSTADGSAEAGSDFTAASGTVTIPAMSSSAQLRVQVVSDSVAEDDETVAVTLSNPVNAVIIDGAATGVILDDDQTGTRTPGVVVNPSAVTVEEGGTANYAVRLSSQPAAEVTVAIAGHSGTDLSLSGMSLGSDDTLTFTTADWNTDQTVMINAAPDADAVDDATVTLTHIATSGSHTSAPVAVAVTINETDTAEVVVAPAKLEVAENGSSTYTVRLATQPSADVTVTVTGHTGSDLTVSAAKLTFTRDNWSTDQTVTVTAASDADGVNDEVALANTASGGGYGAAEAAIVDVTVIDDSSAAIVVKPSPITMAEGSSSSYTVELASLPSADVTVTVSAPEGDLTILRVDPRTLRFTPSDWDQPQTVTLTAGYDVDTADDIVTLTHSGEGGGYDGQSAELPVTISDVESRAEVLVIPASLSIHEGDPGGQTYSVALGAQPTGDVTVTISGHAGSDVTLSGATLTDNALTFTVTNWDAAQVVTLTAAEDPDTANDDVTLTNTAAGGGYGTATASDVAVTVVDNDAPGLVVTPTEVRVTEGDDAGASYEISLASAPTGLVRVSISANSTAVSLVDAVWFTTTDWSDPQTIIVTAGNDADLADENVRLNHRVTSGSYGAAAVQTRLIVEDDDVPGLAVNPQMLSMIEGASATYEVNLTAAPSENVTVTISGHGDSDVTLTGTTLAADALTFTTADWNQAQSVTVAAGQDADTTDDMATLSHTASGGGYDSLEPVGVPVTVIDDDRPRIVVPGAVTVVENASATYGVKLAVQPSAEVKVAISGHAGSEVTLSGNTLSGGELTFTTSNWASAQTVTVAAADDDDAVNESVVLTHTAGGGDYAGLTAQVAVTVIDDDEPEIIVSESEVTVDEADPDGAVYEVRLGTEPSQQVDVVITGAVGTDLALTPEVLTFDSSTWETAKTVKVTAPPDVDTMHEEELIDHRGSGGEYEGASKTLTVIVQDDDIPPGVLIAPTALTVAEGDMAGADYTVVLTSQPAGDVTVTVSGDSGTDVAVSGDTLTSGVLTFTTANWATAQTIKVTAAADDDALADADVTLTHAIASDDDTVYDALADQTVTVTITEKDAAGVLIAPTTLTVTEGDLAGANYTVVLTSEPAGDVTVTVSGDSGTDVAVSGDTLTSNMLTFTTANWATAQTIKVTAAADDDALADADVTLTHAIASDDDTVYDALADQTVTVTITEDDAAGVLIAPTTLTVTEGDLAGANYTVVLTSEPAGDVTVTVSGDSGTDVAVSGDTLTSGVLTFTTANWATAQTIKVTAAADDDALADADVTLTHAIASNDDTAYGALADQTVTVTITEKDTAAVLIAPATLTVTEGDPAGGDYTVVLTSQPAGDVTVTVSGHAGTDVTVSGSTLTDGVLTFTRANWATAQTIKVVAEEDDDADGTLDTGFGTAGTTTTDIGNDSSDAAWAVALQTDGKIIAAGESANDFVVVRYNADGTLDTGFGTAGTTTTDIDNNSSDRAWAAVLQPDGKIIAAGHSWADFALVRYNADGTLDTGFGTAGTTTTDIDNNSTDAAYAVALQPDGKIIAAGDSEGAFVVARYNADGTLDTGFGTAGTTTTDIDNNSLDVAHAVALQTDGKIIAAGDSGLDFALVRYNADGSLDTGFGTAGTTTTDIDNNSSDRAWAVALQTDGKIIAAGQSEGDFVVVRYNADGSLDTGFGTAGTTTTDIDNNSSDGAWAVALQTDAKIIAAGQSEGDFVVVRYNADGSLDTGFGTAGTTTTDIGNDSFDVALAVALQTDGKIIAAGYSANDFVVVRYNADDDVTLTHAIASAHDAAYDALTDQTVTVTVKAAPGVTISPTTLTVAEGDATGVSYTVVLNSQPAGDVTVTISGHDETDLSIASAGLSADDELTFTTANWGTAQTVTVKAAEDDDAVTDADVTLTHAIASNDDTVYDALADQTVTVTVTENDAAGVLIAPATLTVTEGDPAGGDYTVVLTSEPAGDVTVTVSGASGTDVAVSGDTLTGNVLTFTTANWATAQTIKVTAAADDDAVADADVTLAHAIASNDDTVYDALADQTVTVTVTENDAAGVLIAPATLTVTEGDMAGANYTVVLTSQPAGDVTVTVSGDSGTDVAVSGDTLTSGVLTFTTANWATAQTIKVTAAADDDADADADVTLAHAIASDDDTAYGALADQTVTVTITEKDAAGVLIAPATLTVTEGDPTGANYTVVLTSQPAGDVTVTVSGDSGTDVAVSGDTLTSGVLTFTTANWATAQTIKVTAAADDDADADADVALAHAIASDDDTVYDALADQTVTVTITENDAAAVLIAPATLTVTEGDMAGANYTVVLTSEPAGDVTVTVSGDSGTDVTVSGDTLTSGVLTFTTANWATAQTIKVTAAADDDALADADVTLTHAIASDDDTVYDALADQTVTVTITEKDAAAVTISPTTLTVTEGDATGVSYTVALNSQPAGDVTVSVSGDSGTDVAVSGDTLTSGVLTFTTANWATAQTIKVTAAADDDALADADVTLTHAIASTDDTVYDALADQTVTVTITEKDAAAVLIAPATLTVTEGDMAGANYTVVLTSEPAGDVTVTVSGASGTDVTVSGDTLTSGVLTFTTANWATAQTIKVTAAADDDALADADVTLTHAIASDDDTVYDALADQTVTVTITEKDAAAVTISPTTLTVTEGDATGVSYTVALNSQPAGDVTVSVSGDSGTDVTVSGDTLTSGVLTFTTANWATAQTIKVTAAADDDALADADVTLTHAIASDDDTVYDALADQTVTVTVTEKDAAAVLIAPATLTVTEGDMAGANYTVVLTSEPAGDVTVTVSGASGTDVTVSGDTLTSGVLTFTTANWATAQTIKVTAAADDDALADADVALAHAIASDDDTVYDALADQTVTVTVTEKDAAAVLIAPATLTVTEGDMAGANYTVVLTSEPAGDVTVTVSGDSGTDVAVSGDTLTSGVLTFTTANWATAQTIKVTAAADDDALADADVTLTHAIASDDDTAYDALADQTVTVTVTEDDAAGVLIAPATLTVTEGDPTGANYTVVLTSEPAGDVTVTVSGDSGTDVTVSGDTLTSGVLTFTTANWATAQTIKVTAAADDDALADADVTLTHAIASDDDTVYDALADQTVTVTTTEKDAPSRRLPPAPRQFWQYSATQDSIAVAWFSVRTAAEYALEMRASGTTAWNRINGDFDYLPSRTDNRRIIAVATGLNCDMAYEFRVAARGDGGRYDRQFGPESFAVGRTERCPQPDEITNLLVTIELDCAVLTWTAPTGTRATGVQVVRSRFVDYPVPSTAPLDPSADYEYLSSAVVFESLSSTVTTYQDCSTDYPVPGYAYSYAVYALDTEGRRFGHYPSGIMPYGPSNRPERVANVRLTASTAASRQLEWNPSPDWRLAIKTTVRQPGSTSDPRSWAPNPDPWITGYRVERREYSPKPSPTPFVRGWTLLGDDWEVVRHEADGDTSTVFIDNADAGDRLYVYRVWPYNKYGTSRYSPKAFEWAFMEPS